MKKILFPLIVLTSLFSNEIIFAENIKQPNWNGFYLGGNAGYWQSQTNEISTSGSVNFVNSTFEPGAASVANALAQLANNSFSLNQDGFIGGGQVGYNHQVSQKVLLGFNLDLDGLTNSNNTYTLQKSVNLVGFNDEAYVGSLVVKQKINYLGTVRARLGYLFYPTFLVYGTGGFAYGNVTLNTTWTAQESLGTDVFPTIAAQNNISKTVGGWTAGGGIEWLFKPNWSASLEYTYYSLNGLNALANLAQINASVSPPALWGGATANTALSLSIGTVRLGINYHFA